MFMACGSANVASEYDYVLVHSGKISLQEVDTDLLA